VFDFLRAKKYMDIEIAKINGQGAIQGAIAITIDDGLESAPVAATILEKYGSRGTFFIATGYIGSAGYMTSAQIQELYDDGHEIGAHGIDGTSLTTLTESEANNALKTPQDTLISLGITSRSFAYPSGAGAAREHKLASRYYDRVRSNQFNSLTENGFIIYPFTSVQSAEKETVKNIITHIAKTKQKAVFIFHRIGTASGIYMLPDDFEEIVKHAYDLKVAMLTLENLTSPSWNFIPDPWFEQSLSTGSLGFGWIKSGGLTYTIVPGASPWGGNAVTITGGNGATTGYIVARCAIKPSISSMYLRLPYKIVGLTTGYLYISAYYYAADRVTLISSQNLPNITADIDWTVGSLDLTIPANTQWVDVRLTSANANAEAVISLGRVVLSPSYAGDWAVNPS